MKLYSSPRSPYGRKVSVVLHETGLFKNVELVVSKVAGTPLASGDSPTQHNPLGKIPVLVRDDETALYDSRVICRYLDSISSLNLYRHGDEHWKILSLESTAEGIIDAALLMAYEWRMRPEELRFPAWVEGQWKKIERSLTVIENRWMDTLEDTINIGQIGVGCALGYLDFRNSDRSWRKEHKMLAEWFIKFSERDSMVNTIPNP